MLPEITAPLGTILTNAGVSANTTKFMSGVINAVPVVLQTGLAVTQALAPSLEVLRQIADTGQEPTEEDFATLRASINAKVQALRDAEAADRVEKPAG